MLEKGQQTLKEWVPLVEVLRYGDKKVQSPQKRNFFAHAGLEGNITECKVESRGDNKRVYVRYAKEHIKNIERWVKEALGEEK